jgi:cytochrome c oxidase subunit II
MTHITPPDDAYEIRVVGTSWLWQFHYDTGYVSTNELHVPTGQPVRLVMSSDDVIHSFFVPDYRVKRDVIPNRYTQVWFEVTEPGTSIAYCAEYCGTAHSDMLAEVIAHTPEDFEEWLATAGDVDEDMPPAEMGRELVQRQGCLACHSTDGSDGQGPTLLGVYGRDRELQDGSTVTIDENYLRQTLLEPMTQVAAGYPAIMPAYTQLSDRQIDGIIEYLKTLEE